MNKRLILSLLCLSLAISGCDYLPSWMGGKEKEIKRLPGDRVAVLPVDHSLEPDATLKDTPPSVPAVNKNADWPQQSDSFTADSGNLAGGKFTTITQVQVGEGEVFNHTLIPRPVVGGGLVFAMDAAGNISAHVVGHIDSVKWKSPGVAETDIEDVIGGGLAYDHGKLYAISGRGTIAVFDATNGKVLWLKSLHTPLRSAPVIAGNKCFVITIDNQIFALSALSGDILWDQRGISESADLLNNVSPAVSGDVVIVPYSSGELYALSAEGGSEMWNDGLTMNRRTNASATFSGIGGNPVIDGDVVFAISSGGQIAAFQLTQGQRIWDKPIASINTPWLAGNYIYVLTTDNTLVSLYKFDGRVAWSAKLDQWDDVENKRRPIIWKGPVMVDGKLAVVGSYGHLAFVSAIDGKVVSQQTVAPDIYTAPVVAGGKMYLVGQDASLYELQ